MTTVDPLAEIAELPVLMPVAVAAKAISMPTRSLYRLIADGEFPPALKVRRQWRVSRPLLIDWLRTPQEVAS